MLLSIILYVFLVQVESTTNLQELLDELDTNDSAVSTTPTTLDDLLDRFNQIDPTDSLGASSTTGSSETPTGLPIANIGEGLAGMLGGTSKEAFVVLKGWEQNAWLLTKSSELRNIFEHVTDSLERILEWLIEEFKTQNSTEEDILDALVSEIHDAVTLRFNDAKAIIDQVDRIFAKPKSTASCCSAVRIWFTRLNARSTNTCDAEQEDTARVIRAKRLIQERPIKKCVKLVEDFLLKPSIENWINVHRSLSYLLGSSITALKASIAFKQILQ